MARPSIYASLLLFVCLLCEAWAIPGTLGDRPLTEKIELLNGRLIVTMPEGSTVEGREYDIMGAPEPDEDETRVVLEEGPEKLVLMGYEFHATGGQDLDKEVDLVLKQWDNAKYSKSPATVSQGGLSCVFVQQEDADKQATDANLIESLFVKNTDGTIQYLAVYLNPTASKEWKDLAPVAHAILNSVAPGKKRTNLGERSVEVDPGLGLSVTVPAQMMTAMQRGPDFKVLRCYPLRELGAPTGSLFFYVGSHPDFEPKSDSARTPGSLLGQKIDWRGARQSIETLVDMPEWQGHVVHVGISCSDETTSGELRKVAETLCISNPNAPVYQPMEKAKGLKMQGKYREALAEYEKVLRDNPTNLDALYLEADCYANLKDYRSGIAIYSKFLKIDPDNERALHDRANLYFDSGDYRKALNDCNRILRRPQKFPAEFEFRGDVHQKLKNYQGSIADYTSAIGLCNGNYVPVELFVKRASCFRLLGQYPNAIADCTKALAISKSEDYYDERAKSYALIGRKDLARLDKFAAQDIRVHTLNYGYPAPSKTKIILPKQFLGAWEVEEAYPTIKAEPKFSELAKKLFLKKRSSVWTITGDPRGGYFVTSTQGFKARMAVDKLDYMAAYVRFQVVVDGYVVENRVSMSMKPDYRAISGLERVGIMDTGKDQSECRAVYSINAKRAESSAGR